MLKRLDHRATWRYGLHWRTYLVGLVSGVTGGLKDGLLLGAIFPLILFVSVLMLKKGKKKEEKQS